MVVPAGAWALVEKATSSVSLYNPLTSRWSARRDGFLRDGEVEGGPVVRFDQVGDTIYRISSFMPEKRLSFNQFLIDDERPALVHTGTYPMYDDVRAAVA